MTNGPIGIVLVGALGRMGRAITDVIAGDDSLHLTCAIERSGHPGLGTRLIGDVSVVGEVPANVPGSVLIDFSTPETVAGSIRIAVDRRMGLVLGTTGLAGSNDAELSGAARSIPVVAVPNMSRGVTVLYELVRQATTALRDYDVEIVEAHHRGKTDAPSGTALRLAEIVAASREDAKLVHGREGKPGARGRTEIGLHAMRGGDVAGEHTVWLAGDGERVEITHRASSRRAFAEGAVAAARFVAGAASGRYDMRDVIGVS